MKVLRTDDKKFQARFAEIINRGSDLSAEVEENVKDIILQVKEEGDAALLRLTEKFDGHGAIDVSREAVADAYTKVDEKLLASAKTAYRRIESFHRKQIQNSWNYTDKGGEVLGQLVRPIERVGMYVPGGKAVYPSSVLMNAVPARVAGVHEIIMVTPGKTQHIDPLILIAADMCGIQKIFKVGGAQAVAALAYGTETIPKVDKIVGPGNIYVATAKRFVYGDVDIDMIAGPSEILIISDGTGSPSWAAADMLSQAEHDEMASSILMTTDEQFARSVEYELSQQLEELSKKQIAKKSLERHGAIVLSESLEEAVKLANEVAPEHLELYVKNPWDLLDTIKNAGAVFLGHYTPEAVGDYLAGPNHVLPTGGTARFYSPLSVDDFIKKTSLISFSEDALLSVGDDVVALAQAEGLDAHEKSVAKRLHDIRTNRSKA